MKMQLKINTVLTDIMDSYGRDAVLHDCGEPEMDGGPHLACIVEMQGNKDAR